MRITWYGHAAFLVETAGVRLIFDPYRSPDCGGYGPVGDPADVVVVSHLNDKYHSHLGQIEPPFQVVHALALPPEGIHAKGLHIQAVRVYESPERKLGDEVTVVHFRSEGLHVVHLGDLGHLLSDAELRPLRAADVVMVPAGGLPTLDLPDIPPLLDALGARLILPMHYKTPKIDLNIQPVERFLDRFPNHPVDRPKASTIEVTPQTLPDSPRIVVLDHAR